MVNHYPEQLAIETVSDRGTTGRLIPGESDRESGPLSAYEKGVLNLSELLACENVAFTFNPTLPREMVSAFSYVFAYNAEEKRALSLRPRWIRVTRAGGSLS
jgi:hypothetical protein